MYVAFLFAESTEHGNLRRLFYFKKKTKLHYLVLIFGFLCLRAQVFVVLASLKFSCVAAWKYERFGSVIIKYVEVQYSNLNFWFYILGICLLI